MIPIKTNPNKWAEAAVFQEWESTSLCPITDWHSPWHHPFPGDEVQSWDSSVPFLPAFCQQSLHWHSWLRTSPKVQMLLSSSRRVAWNPFGTTASPRGMGNPSHLRMGQMFPKLNYTPASPREGGEHHFGSPLDFEKTVLFSAFLPPKIHTLYLNSYLSDLSLFSAGSSCWLLHSLPGVSSATLVYGAGQKAGGGLPFG